MLGTITLHFQTCNLQINVYPVIQILYYINYLVEVKIPTTYIATLPIRHIKLVFLWVGALGRVGLEFYFEFQQATYRIGEAVA